MTDPIEEGVKLVPLLRRGLVNDPVHGKGLRGSAMNYDVVETIIAALVAAGEMAGEKPGPCETCGGSGEIPTVEGDEALCPACAAAPVEDVEKVARAIWNVDAHPARKNWDEAIQSDDYSEALNDCRAYARAALAAIGRT